MGDVLHVFLVRLHSDTRSLAVLDMILQANIELTVSDVLRSKSKIARAQRIQFLDQL